MSSFDKAHTPGVSHGRRKFRSARDESAGKEAAVCELVMLAIVNQFLQQYPDIRIEIFESDAFVDVVAGGFDAGALRKSLRSRHGIPGYWFKTAGLMAALH